jgi:two-component system response regulator YesN
VIRLPTIIKASSKWVTHTFLLSIIPVILFGTFIYYMGARIVQEEIHRSSMESLSQVRHQVESNLINIEQMSNHLALQTSIIAAMNTQSKPSLGSSQLSNDVRNLLLQMKNVTNTVHSIYFYHIGQEIVINHNVVTNYNEERVFRDLSWRDHMQEMIAANRHQIWVTPRELMNLNGETISTLTHIRVLPLLYNEPKAAIVVNLNTEFLDQTISRFPLNSDGILLVVNAEGQLIANISKDKAALEKPDVILREMERASPEEAVTVRSGKYFISMLQSGHNDWKYAIAVPADAPRKQVDQFGLIIIVITSLLCVLVVYSAYFTHSNFQRNIRSLLDRVSPSRSTGNSLLEGDAIAEVEVHINRLLDEVKVERNKQDVHLPMLRAHYLHALIHGNAIDIFRLAQEMENSDIFPYDTYCVMVAQMDDSANSSFHSERELFLFAVSNIGIELNKLQKKEGAPFRIETVITDRHSVLIVNCSADRDSEKLPVLLADQLRSVVKQILKHTLTIGVGTSVDSASNLAYSYREALQALRMNLANAYDEVLPYANMTLVAERLVQYPVAEEQDLLNALRGRDIDRVERGLKAFRAKLEGDLASFPIAKTFYLQLLVAVIRLVQEYEEDIAAVFGENPYESYFRIESIPQIDNWLYANILVPIVQYMESVKRRKTDTMIKLTVDLIHERYASDLSMQMAADNMGISASYLSKLFKEELGETFIDYVTRIRLEQAQALLVDTDLTMGQIAEEIGYASVQQMFRVFKKKISMTPGEYRGQSSKK